LDIADAVKSSQAVIRFNPDGTIRDANQVFLDVMGYARDEIVGQHHRMFVPAQQRESAEYREFWASLRRGDTLTRIFRRLRRDGSDIWLQASYIPTRNRNGDVAGIVKIATDVTERVLRDATFAGQVEAIGKSMAVIEFDLDGTILTANRNFLDAMGYSLEEIRGRHHRIFVAEADAGSAEYKQFWQSLSDGRFSEGEYRRIAKGGREVWIQASYNPIRDMDGKSFKVIKFASDITERKLKAADAQGQIDAIHASQAVIEFELDGTIRTANENFLAAVGYSLGEIKGKNHRMFVGRDEKAGQDYKAFWDALRRGEFQAGEYRRLGKGGREVWIQASYNPIRDIDGRPVKVVKFAADVTEQVLARKRAEHVQQLMETIAAGAEQLNASVSEIAESMVKSRETTTEAFDLVVSANDQTSALDDATRAMGGIVEAINDITGQISLLALNATIESARAGEAGKGFAVVANEVKNLANQAKSATDRITENIDRMRGVSTDVVASLAAIRKAMDDVREYVASTATAVEEQSSVANDMSANMQRASEEARNFGAR
jgi:methyl-accepting chemotaxis protein